MAVWSWFAIVRAVNLQSELEKKQKTEKETAFSLLKASVWKRDCCFNGLSSNIDVTPGSEGYSKNKKILDTEHFTTTRMKMYYFCTCRASLLQSEECIKWSRKLQKGTNCCMYILV